MTDTTTDAAEARARWETGRNIPKVEQRHRDAAAWAMDQAPDFLTWDKAMAAHVSPNRRWQMNRVAEAMARMERDTLATAEAASGAGEREAVGYQVRLCTGKWSVVLYSKEEATAAVADERNTIIDSRPVFASLPPATDPAMVTVPKEPTEAMMAAWESACPAMGWDALQDMSDEDANRALVRAEWSAMLAAAPTIPATGEAEA